jgi:hypothetical protein
MLILFQKSKPVNQVNQFFVYLYTTFYENNVIFIEKFLTVMI